MAKIKCNIKEDFNDEYGDSVIATCSKCGHSTESFGIEESSIKRSLVLLSKECPNNENNFYIRN